MTAEKRAKLKKMFQQVEVIAGDLQEMFKQEAVEIITENPCEFAMSLQKGETLDDSFLSGLADAQSQAWKLFSKLDALAAGDAAGQSAHANPHFQDGQKFDVTYHVAYKAPVHVLFGESLVDAMKSMPLPQVPQHQKEVGFKVEKVEIDGREIPNPNL